MIEQMTLCTAGIELLRNEKSENEKASPEMVELFIFFIKIELYIYNLRLRVHILLVKQFYSGLK